MKDLDRKVYEVLCQEVTDQFPEIKQFDLKFEVIEVEPDYKKGYEILSEYFDSISDEEKTMVDRLLKQVGL